MVNIKYQLFRAGKKLKLSLRRSDAKATVKQLEKDKGKLSILYLGKGNSFTEDLIKRGHIVKMFPFDLITDATGSFLPGLGLPFPDQAFDLALSVDSYDLNPSGNFLGELKRISDKVLIYQDNTDDNKAYEHSDYDVSSTLLGSDQTAVYNIVAKHYVWLILLSFLVTIVIWPMPPLDDLCRHLIAYKYDYDYSKLYVYTYMPSYDPYIIFDMLAGWSDRLLGEYGPLPFQLGAAFFLGWAFIAATRKAPPHIRATFLVLLMSSMRSRILLGRPATIIGGIFLLLWICDGRLPRAVKLIIGSLLAPFYWLFFVYVAPLIARDRIYALALLFGLAFWTVYVGGDYYSSIHMLINGLNSRVMEVAENQSLIQITPMAFLFIPLIMYAAKDWRTFGLFMLYAMTNQIRYAEIFMPLSTTFTKFIKKDVPYAVPLCLLPLLLTYHPYASKTPDFQVLKNQIVLTDSMHTSYMIANTVYPVKLAPPIEFGWLDRNIQLSIKGMLDAGKLDCSVFDKYKFTYVVENSLKEIPECLQLNSVRGSFRIWQVNKQASGSGSTYGKRELPDSVPPVK